jgi:hypothetical protein
MKSFLINIISFIILFISINSVSIATPSTIIWIPSVDIQSYKVFHLGIDNYFTLFKKGIGQGGVAFPTDIDLTVGFLPFEKIQAEVGIDLFEPTKSPWVFNAKIGVPENALSDYSPAFAIGGMNFGVEKNSTDYNMFYGIIAKTFPFVGRLSIGYYVGNKNLLLDNNGNADNSGILFSWDKQLTEINENLWLAVDYQGGKNSFGAASFGFAWSFSKNVSVIFARNIYNNCAPSTFTTQLDINL